MSASLSRRGRGWGLQDLLLAQGGADEGQAGGAVLTDGVQGVRVLI